MIEYKTIINKDGHIVSVCELVKDKTLLTYKLKHGETIVERCTNGKLVKPQWTGEKWEESATEEEIKAYEEENKANTKSNLEERISLLEDTINCLILGGNE